MPNRQRESMRASGIPLGGGLTRVPAVLLACVLLSSAAYAQPAPKYPVKPVRMLGGAFGSPSDILARTLGPKLSELWGQPVVIENRPGAAGTIAAAILSK